MCIGLAPVSIAMTEKQKQQLWTAIRDWDKCIEIGEILELYEGIELIVDVFIKEAYKRGASDGYEDCWNAYYAND